MSHSPFHTPELRTSMRSMRSATSARGSTRTDTLAGSARSKNYTPFRKPSSRRQILTANRRPERTNNLGRKSRRSRNPIESDDSETEEEEHNYRGLTKKTWKVYKVTPMHNFKHDARSLKHYGKQAAAFIHSFVLKGTLTSPEEQADKASVRVLKGFKVTSGDVDAIEMVFKGKSNKDGEENVRLTAILCCVHRQEEDIEHKVKQGFTVLPLMLIKGPVNLTNCFTQWLQTQFGCGSSPFVFQHEILCWLLSMWSGSLPESSKKPVILVYEMPKGIKNMSKLTLEIDSSDCKALWNSIHDENEEMYDEKEMATFMNALQQHFYSVFKIHLDALTLSRVGTAIAYVGSEGRLKIFDKDHVLAVLGKLTELSLEETLPHRC